MVEEGSTRPHGQSHWHGQRLQLGGHHLVLHNLKPPVLQQPVPRTPLLRHLRRWLGGAGSGRGCLGPALLLLLALRL